MTMLRFRMDEAEANQAQAWADRLGLDRSELLREALRRHLQRLASEMEARIWEEHPLNEGEQSLAEIADSGPAEDWSDWLDAPGWDPGRPHPRRVPPPAGADPPSRSTTDQPSSGRS